LLRTGAVNNLAAAGPAIEATIRSEGETPKGYCKGDNQFLSGIPDCPPMCWDDRHNLTAFGGIAALFIGRAQLARTPVLVTIFVACGLWIHGWCDPQHAGRSISNASPTTII
jgi:hypothetical protein